MMPFPAGVGSVKTVWSVVKGNSKALAMLQDFDREGLKGTTKNPQHWITMNAMNYASPFFVPLVSRFTTVGAATFSAERK